MYLHPSSKRENPSRELDSNNNNNDGRSLFLSFFLGFKTGIQVMHGFVVRSTANESGLKRIYEALGVKKLPALVATFGLQQGRSGSISRSSSRMDFSESSSNRVCTQV